jgi:hypothetical protein
MIDWWTWGGSNSRPHGCKAEFIDFASISPLLFLSFIRCYFIEIQHVKTSSTIWVVGVVELSFAAYCPTSMPVKGKFWAMFCREL